MEIYLARVLQWLEKVKSAQPQVCDWIGIYYKESYLHQINSTDLVIGPYIGEVTDHVRISIDRGFCGMALREERTVNVADVTTDSTHIACSLKTRSELVVPIANKKGEFVAELDIDCNKLNAFSPELEKYFQDVIKSFPLLEEYLPFPVEFFETERLILRKFTQADLQDIFDYCKNPNVARYVTWEPHETLKDSQKFIDFALSSYAKGCIDPMAMVLKDDSKKKVIGSIGVMAVNPKNRTFELAYALSEEVWGKGFAVEASKPLINYVFQNFAIERLQCRCDILNPQSSRVMEKLGMNYEGTLKASMYLKGITRDMHMYSIVKPDFKPY
ncbi:MAG: GNAT family N-acetyltransferase [Rhizobacter sp.]|nr:GNAT family N-acetyltransferase [Bacteriovorax sp.]